MKHWFHIIPLLSLLISLYFGYHGFYGRRGLLRLQQIDQETLQAQTTLDHLSQQIDEMRLKKQALQSGSQDLIEEELLRVLNMGNEDDLIVLEETGEPTL